MKEVREKRVREGKKRGEWKKSKSLERFEKVSPGKFNNSRLVDSRIWINDTLRNATTDNKEREKTDLIGPTMIDQVQEILKTNHPRMA